MRWFRQLCGRGFVVGFVGLVGALTCVTAMSTPLPAHALLKPIIIFTEEIEPVALLSDNGRQLQVPLTGEVAEWVPGLRTRTLVLVYQEETGAFAVGHHRSPFHVDDEDIPERVAFDVRANAVGPNRFVEGPAVVQYFAEAIQNGKVIREWSRQEEVLLLHEVP